MNIMVPQGDDDYVSVDPESFTCDLVLVSQFMFFAVPQREFPVPEQFKTVWDGSKLLTEPTEIAG